MPKTSTIRTRRTAPKPSRPIMRNTRPAARPHLGARNADLGARRRQLAISLDLQRLNETERIFLAVCQQIFGRWTGDNAPFEAFFVGLVHRVERGDWPT